MIFKKYFLVLQTNQIDSAKNIHTHVPWNKWPPGEDTPMSEIFQVTENVCGQVWKIKESIF